DLEHPAGVVAADAESVRPRPDDPQVVVGDLQLAAGQHDGAAQAGREVDLVGAGRAVGLLDSPPQRAGAAVGQVAHQEGRQRHPPLQPLQPEGAPPPGTAADPGGVLEPLDCGATHGGWTSSRPDRESAAGGPATDPGPPPVTAAGEYRAPVRSG